MPYRENAREELRRLVQKYKDQKREIANEEQACQSLILPLFSKVLGWDTEDPSEFKSQYSQRGKRSDYVVFLNGISQFVIEAKALDREIKQNYQDYEQAINYAKNKEKDFAILTNFKQFIVLRADTEAFPLQCEVKVIDIEKAAEKEEDFNIIWNFQKEAWYAEKGDALYRLKPGKKVEPVSKRLVEDMREWRSALLNNIRKHSRLNDFADFDKERPYIEQEVQRFIDRLIFICYCEDKELREKELKGLLELKESKHFGKESFLVNEVKELFKDYRVHYDSDLFFEQGYCDRFRFEDSVLTEIIVDLRKPFRRLAYNFADIEADVLGKAYENFIGHTITGEKRFGEKESKSKRKEEGVYYTPQYIVNYIVDNTLREYIKENKISSFDDLLKIKVLDPACGSGTFLIRAFEVLEGEARRILGRQLDYDEKVKLLISCIFGVDKDERAVDITKLRLSLSLAARQKLPELGKNIQCGDSLIDNPAIVQEKAFKWEERFKDVFKQGGFDVVVGNPPYGAELENKDRSFLEAKHKLGNTDTAALFMDAGKSLVKKKGVNGFIIPKPFVYAANWQKIRKDLLNGLYQLIDVGKVWKEVKLEQAIYFYKKDEKIHNYNVGIRKKDIIEIIGTINKETFDEFGFLLNGISNKELLLGKKIRNTGLGLNSFVLNQRGGMYQNKVTTKQADFKVLGGAQIGRYGIKQIRGHIANKYVNDDQALLKSNSILVQNIVAHIENPKDHIKIIATMPKAIDTQRYVILDTINQLENKSKIRTEVILGIINSKLIGWYAYRFVFGKAIRTMHFDNSTTEKIIIPEKVNEQKQETMVKLVDKILSLHNRLSELGDKHTVERERIEEEIKKTDAEIDKLVYQLYGITEDEKRIIEESLKLNEVGT